MKTNKLQTIAFGVLATSAVLVVSSSCGTRTDGNAGDVDTTLYDTTGEVEVEKDPELKMDEKADYNGQNYTITVHRTPADSLPQVKDSYGDPFLDNEVKVTLRNAAGVVFSRVVRKTDFATAAAGLDLSKLVLGGMMFSSINASGVHFDAQLNSPGSEEGGNNFKITLSHNGQNLQIVRDETAEDVSISDIQE